MANRAMPKPITNQSTAIETLHGINLPHLFQNVSYIFPKSYHTFALHKWIKHIISRPRTKCYMPSLPEFLRVPRKKGFLKFSARRTPNNSAAPRTISMHPEKSVYISRGYRNTAIQGHMPLNVLVSAQIALTISAILSEITNFLNNPHSIL